LEESGKVVKAFLFTQTLEMLVVLNDQVIFFLCPNFVYGVIVMHSFRNFDLRFFLFLALWFLLLLDCLFWSTKGLVIRQNAIFVFPRSETEETLNSKEPIFFESV
jgi:hypothetical protein